MKREVREEVSEIKSTAVGLCQLIKRLTSGEMVLNRLQWNSGAIVGLQRLEDSVISQLLTVPWVFHERRKGKTLITQTQESWNDVSEQISLISEPLSTRYSLLLPSNNFLFFFSLYTIPFDILTLYIHFFRTIYEKCAWGRPYDVQHRPVSLLIAFSSHLSWNLLSSVSCTFRTPLHPSALTISLLPRDWKLLYQCYATIHPQNMRLLIVIVCGFLSHWLIEIESWNQESKLRIKIKN